MRILFVARHYTYFRNFDSVLRELASRGHHIRLAVQMRDAMGGEQAVKALTQQSPTITCGVFPDDEGDRWRDLSHRLRLGLDYLRYLDDFYDDAPLRRVRARERTPIALLHLAEPPVGGGPAWRRRVGGWLHGVDRTIPPPLAVERFLEEERPDILLITPLVDLGSQQIDIVRAARARGIPTGLCVWSWDHLSSKAYLREYPERVFVWNDTQRREALDVHGVPPARVVVTGAQCFDHWFDRQPSRSREQLCRELGLPPERPIILYVCTALIMGSPSEPDFVEEWLTQVRASHDPLVATAGVLIRPHPSQTAKWEGVDLSRFGPVAVWGSNPVDGRSRADYFDSLFHSAAVVGLNTSAFIEAGIVGRQVLAILVPRFHDNQEGTVHFRYLLQTGGGLLRVSRALDEHIAQLEQALRVPAGTDHPHRAFLESFVRPRGLAEPATPVFVEAVESLGQQTVSSADLIVTSPWRTRLVGALATLTQQDWMAFAVQSPRERDSETRLRTVEAEKSARRTQYQAAADERRAERDRREEEQRAARAEALREKERHRERKGRRARGRATTTPRPGRRGATAMTAFVRGVYRRLTGSEPRGSGLP